MSDNFDGHTTHDGRHVEAPSGNSEHDPGVRPPGQDVLKSASPASRGFANWRVNRLRAAMSKHKLLTVLVILLIVPVAALIVAYVTRPAPGTASQAAGLDATTSDNNAGDKIAKPAPGRPLLSASQAPLPTLSSPPAPPPIPNQAQSGLTGVPQRPLAPAPNAPNSVPNPTGVPAAPVAAGKPPFTAMVYSARHEKHFGGSCDGQLTLDGTGLVFRCSDDPGGSFQVALADIEAVDSNGIRLRSGKKYHFDIAGMSKDGEEQLFANWLQQIR
jgi:hypothetical protein